MTELSKIFGFEIIPNPFLLEIEESPVKKLRRKNWMSDSYFYRIQKKWVKRFGYKKVRPVLKMGNRILTHPNNIKLIKLELSKRTIVTENHEHD